MAAIASPESARHAFLTGGMRDVGYRRGTGGADRRGTWRISPTPLELPEEDVAWLRRLGVHLHAFNRACCRLYMESVNGRQPRWIASYLDRGKPESLVARGRKGKAGRELPTIIRPDVIPLPDGMWITELDSVPGGMGVIGRACELYGALGHDLVSDTPLPAAFADMFRSVTGRDAPRVAIVVSDESADYRPEMEWLGRSLAPHGVEARTVAPEALKVSGSEVAVEDGSGGLLHVDAVYRFFELFDLASVAHSAELMRLDLRNSVAVVPPFRPFLEEKMWAALFHHPSLKHYWRQELGLETVAFLEACTPPTWILDPTPVPPHATIPGLSARGRPVGSWTDLADLGRAERNLVIKPSGFSERAWGSRGVVIGDDVGRSEWNAALARALGEFPHGPHVLQVFRAGRRFECPFYDDASGELIRLQFRARLSPYYVVVGDDVRLTAVMATLCPLDKKKLHGMPEAVIVPCGSSAPRTGGLR